MRLSKRPHNNLTTRKKHKHYLCITKNTPLKRQKLHRNTPLDPPGRGGYPITHHHKKFFYTRVYSFFLSTPLQKIFPRSSLQQLPHKTFLSVYLHSIFSLSLVSLPNDCEASSLRLVPQLCLSRVALSAVSLV